MPTAKCEGCGAEVEVDAEWLNKILERKRQNPRARMLCRRCFSASLPVPAHRDRLEEYEEDYYPY